MILFCGCTNGPNGVKQAVEDQDMRYGKGKRVHTPMVKEDMYRCTICSKERSSKSSAEEKKSKKKLAKEKS